MIGVSASGGYFHVVINNHQSQQPHCTAHCLQLISGDAEHSSPSAVKLRAFWWYLTLIGKFQKKEISWNKCDIAVIPVVLSL